MVGDSQDFHAQIHQATDRAKGLALEQQQARDIGRAAVANVLNSIWIRFQEASVASSKALEFEREASTGGATRFTLTWTASAPVRQLSLQPSNVGGYIYWEIRADFSTIDVYPPNADKAAGVVAAMDLTSDRVDSLIMAILDQKTWGAGRMPHVEVPGSTSIEPA